VNIPYRGDRVSHAQKVKEKFDLAWKEAENQSKMAFGIPDSISNGVYLQIKGKPGFDLITKSLEHIGQGVRLLNVTTDENETITATVFVPNNKQNFFIKKIDQYGSSDKKNEEIAAIEDIKMAIVSSMWIGDRGSMPMADPKWCEVWLRYEVKEEWGSVRTEFIAQCEELGVLCKNQAIVFPERLVLGIFANAKQLSTFLVYNSHLAEYRLMKSPTSFFTNLDTEEQIEWINDLKNRTDYSDRSNTSICLLDSGINNGHPLLNEFISDDDLQTIDDAKGVHDINGHGTNMASIALYFNLEDKLESSDTLEINHVVESVKMVNTSGDNNDEQLYGDLTKQAVALAEIKNPSFNRTICMALTAPMSSFEKAGNPSSWSGAIDSMIAGVGEEDSRRLMFVSAGNTHDYEIKEHENYIDAITNHSVEDPGQAWNCVTVGAYTNKNGIGDPDFKEAYTAVAQENGLSPFTSTSQMWQYRKWPIKPEIVLEGGNLAFDAENDFYTNLEDLSLLAAAHDFTEGNHFTFIQGTSPATAQASWMAANIEHHYPEFWPETVRALMVHSANWTQEMKDDLGISDNPSKTEYRRLLRACGYGLPDLQKAIWSASNSVNMIIQDELQPFCKNKSVTYNEMHIHSIPWPNDLLAELGEAPVKMHITLSYYIEPGPGEVGWKDKYRYPSCGLVFDVNNPTEDTDSFIKRISRAMRDAEDTNRTFSNDSTRWRLGTQNRDVGSIHSDIWESTAINLSMSNKVIVYPISGWWKSRPHLKQYESKVRYSLVVTIETPDVNVDLYTAIENEIKNKALVKTEVTAL
jgi:hypothetical protein